VREKKEEEGVGFDSRREKGREKEGRTAAPLG